MLFAILCLAGLKCVCSYVCRSERFSYLIPLAIKAWALNWTTVRYHLQLDGCFVFLPEIFSLFCHYNINTKRAFVWPCRHERATSPFFWRKKGSSITHDIKNKPKQKHSNVHKTIFQFRLLVHFFRLLLHDVSAHQKVYSFFYGRLLLMSIIHPEN